MAFLISLTMIIFQVGSSLNSAAGRYVTEYVSKQQYELASSYYSNILMSVVVGGGIVTALLIAVYAGFGDSTFLPILLVATMFLASYISLTAVVIGVGTFVTQRFYLRDSIRSAGAVLSFFVMVLLLKCAHLGLWAVVLGNLSNSLVQLFGFSTTWRKLLPGVSFSCSLVRMERIREIFLFCMGSMLAFGGGYLVRAGTLWAVKNTSTSVHLGEYAVAYQVGTILATSIGALLMVSSPAIYRFLAQGKTCDACHQIESYNYLGVFWGLTILIFVWSDGESILRLWLGNKAVDPGAIQPIMIATCVSAMLACMASPMGTFLVGCNRFMDCGIITLIEGVLVASSAYVFLKFLKGSLVLVALIPGVFSAVKQLLIYLVFYRELFTFSSAKTWLRKMLFLLGYMLMLYILNTSSRRIFSGFDAGSLALRCFIAMAPLVPVLWIRLKRAQIA